MRLGTIDSSDYIDYSTLVVDCELFFDIKVKWFKKHFIIKDSSIVASKYMYKKDIDGTYDRIVIGCVGDFVFREKVLKKIGLPYELIDLENEENYKNWLWVVMPDLHLTIRERDLYYSNSVSLEKFVDN